jgi:RimJ/RimL family protein N-acetyltransferase
MFARTERLLLRPGWIQDAPALYRAIADEGVIRNLASPPWPYAPAHAEAFLATERRAGEPSALIFLRTGAAPELIGTIGLGEKPDGARELGYWIARPHWGRGYATEAGRALLAFARDGLRLDRLQAGHFLDNPASGRVLEKLGFRPTGRTVPRFTAGRGETVPSREFELELSEAAEQDEAPKAEAMAA